MLPETLPLVDEEPEDPDEPDDPELDELDVPEFDELEDPDPEELDEPEELVPELEEPEVLELDVELFNDELDDVCDPRVAAQPALNSAIVASTLSRINLGCGIKLPSLSSGLFAQYLRFHAQQGSRNTIGIVGGVPL